MCASIHLTLCILFWCLTLVIVPQALPQVVLLLNRPILFITAIRMNHYQQIVQKTTQITTRLEAHFNACCQCSFSAFIPWIGHPRINCNESVTGSERHHCSAEDLLLLFPLRWKLPSLVLRFALSLSTFPSVSLPLSLSLYLYLTLCLSTSLSVSLPLSMSLYLSLAWSL